MSDARSQQVSPATSLPLQRATDAEAVSSARGDAPRAATPPGSRLAARDRVDRVAPPPGHRRSEPRRGERAERHRSPGAQTGAAEAGTLLSGRTLVVLTALATMTLALLDRSWTGRLSQFFDLCFVLVCIVAALAVRRSGLFTIGVLPPLVLATVIAVLAAVDPATLTAQHLGFASTLLTGLAHHAAALVAGHGSALAVLVARGTLGADP